MYVRPSDFVIPAESTAIHGITPEFAAANGQPLVRVLRDLEADLRGAALVVGHNISFDRAILQSEAWRNSMDELAMMMEQMSWACTMRCAMDRLQTQTWPKLTALHKKLFGEEFGGAHNAMEDVRATARCWLQLRSEGYML
jgi:DNA polymerase III epsilon subunit-like protein